MSNNAYNDFKNGIKSDVKETGASLLLVGGLILLVAILSGALLFAFKDTKSDDSTHFLVGGVAAIISLLLLFSPAARTLILQFWIIGLIAIPLLFVAFIALYILYIAFTQSFS